jgi:hypothetical protein
MRLSAFSELVVDALFQRGTAEVSLRINIDAFTPDYFRALGQRLEEKVSALTQKQKLKGRKDQDEKFFEHEARALEVSREIYVEFLYPDVLRGWDLTEDDDVTPIPLNAESLMRLPPNLVKELLDFCVEQSRTVKKRLPAAEITESMPDGSPALRVVGQST